MSGDELEQERPKHRVEKRDGRVVVIDPTGLVNEDCARFLDTVSVRGLSTWTAEAYAYDLALVHRWLAISELELRQLDAEQLHRFLAWEKGRASHPSINRRLHTLRLYYRFVTGQELPGGVERRGHYRLRHRDRARPAERD
jgi:hypothetical protein